MLPNKGRDVMAEVRSGMRIFVQGGAATPNRLIDLLLEEADRLAEVELVHLHTMGPARYTADSFKNNFKVANFFVGENMRKAIDYDRVDYIPCFLSEIPQLMKSKRLPIDIALVHLSPPDKNGYCTLGTSVDIARAAVESATFIIAQINRQMPRVHGDGCIHISRLHRYIEIDEPLPESEPSQPSEDECAIGKNVASLVEDGATIQIGIGSIPDAVLSQLAGHKHLGLHSETWTDGALKLLENGAIDNSRKVIYQGRSVSGFVFGSRRLYDFINDNPSVVQLDIGYVNDPNTIARNPKVTAINSAVEIDLTGQICSDSIGPRVISGVGGQMDFMRGASQSPGGKPIIAISSRTRSGQSKIVPILRAGAGVVTTRAHVHFIATEYGVVDLYGKTLHERAKLLTSIAHPDDRESLARAWTDLIH
jgi:4-hydroxybutyrate CoA-transferase